MGAHASVTCVSPGAAPSTVGAIGTATGVANTSVTLPLPAALTGRRRNLYCVPFVRPVFSMLASVGGVHGDAHGAVVHESVDGAADASPSVEPTALFDELSARTWNV